MSTHFRTRLAALALLVALSTPAVAHDGPHEETVVIDETTPGCVSDAILDGFPSLAPRDGNGDFGNNALAVALQDGVTEERAVIEFPLDELAGLAASGVEGATLTFNIDDVLSTFGPGTSFDGTGPDSIRVAAYTGDGEVTLADFARGDGPVLSSVDTDASGPVTDATLAATGPLVFVVDVRDVLLDALTVDADFLGFVFATDDHKASASLDDLGPGGTGPAGTGGARRPHLTVSLAPGITTTTTTLPDLLCGDANEDGTVSSTDALRTLRAAVGSTTCDPAACDVDANTKITAADASRILRFAVGLNVTLDCSATAALPRTAA